MLTIGIDFGTTNSCAAYWGGSEPRVLEMADGKETLPSVIALTPKGVLTGRPALRQINENPRYTFRHVKRYLGRDFSEDTDSYQIEKGQDGRVWWAGPDRLWSGPELVAELFKAILLSAEAAIGARPDGAVLTIPVDFREPQRAALREAATLAGLTRCEFYHEPEAAALAFGLVQEKFGRALVYDWGGGTFDVAVLNVGDTSIGVRDHGGVSDVGGADIDQLIVDHCSRILARDGHDVTEKPYNQARLQIAAEEAKIDLSSAMETRIYLDHFLATPEGVEEFKQTITRAELEDLAEPLVKSTMDATITVLERQDLKPNEIDYILLVGGQTRMPLVSAVIEAFFDRKPTPGVRADYAVSLGAAIHAAELDGRKKPSTTERIASVSVGLRRDNGNIVVAIPKGASLPAEFDFELTSMTDGQEALSVQIYEGEQPMASLNTLIVDHPEPVEAMEQGGVTVAGKISRAEGGALSVTVGGRPVYP